MKKIIATVACLALAACGRPMEIGGHVYPTYGLLNENTQKSDRVCYEASWGNIFWSVVLVETVIAPFYFVGFSLFNPVGPSRNGQCGIDARDGGENTNSEVRR